MRVVVTTPPTLEPVTLDEVKEGCGVENDHFDARLDSLAVAARKQVERLTGRSLVTTRLTATFDAFEMRGGFMLPYGPVQSPLVSFTTYDAGGTGTALTTSDYQLAGDFVSGHPNGGYWVPGRPHDSSVVVYDAGYGDAPADVPEPIKEYIIALTRGLFDGEGVTDAERSLIAPFISYQFG